MKRMTMHCTALAILGLVIGIMSGSTNAADDKAPSSKEIMQKINGKGGLLGAVKAAAPAKGEPKFDVIAEKAKELTPLAVALAKNPCKKGEKESWEKLSKAYGEAATKLEAGAKAKDAKAVAEGIKGLSTCGDCHKAHK